MKGFFVAFEGIDGVGKSTQAGLLAAALAGKGYPVLSTREPGGTALGEKLRGLLLDRALAPAPWTEVFLYAACRAQHVAEKIRPALEKGHVVIADRFLDSTLAYQGFGRGLALEELERISLLAAGGLVPDLTVLLDMPVEEALGRLAGRPDRLEGEGREFFRRVRRGYLWLAARHPDRYLVLDARLSPLELHRAILEAFEVKAR